MRVILDTNILISALISPSGVPGHLYRCWRAGRFILISCEEQFDEFRRVTRYARVRRFIGQAAAGTMLNELKSLSECLGSLPNVERCSDPADNFLLAMAEAGNADYLITGDGRHLLSVARHVRTKIISAEAAASLLGYSKQS